jgi:hypothetical protein
MLIPRFSLRWLLAVTSASGVFFLIVAQAVRGSSWARGICLAALYLVVCLAFYVLAWGATMILAKTRGARPEPLVVTTPFATAEPPAQIIPPEDPE